MVKNNKKSKVTLDDLAQMTKVGFDAVDGKFSKIDERFNKVDKRLDKIEENTGYLKTHMVDKYYLSDKLADLAVEIYKRLDKKLEKEREFKKRITEIIKRNKLATPREIAYLEGLVR